MSKHDTVIGYIEYLDCNGCVRERIPYVDAEKFKTRIYASLYCGEPIIPVVFPKNLSQPLTFEKGTIFPWGLRSEKHELLPYEIYQTNNRKIAFLRYDYTKDHINAASYKLVYRGQMECWQTLDSLYCLHNQENRPNVSKLNRIYEQLGYTVPKKISADRKNAETRRQIPDPMLTCGKTMEDIDPRPSFKTVAAQLRKAAARSAEHAVNATRKEER